MSAERPPLPIEGGAAGMAEWLKTSLGTGATSGIFRRGDALVHCPLVGEFGYIAPDKDEGDDGPSQVRKLHRDGLTSLLQYTFWCHRMTDDGPRNALFPEDAARIAINGVWALDGVRPLRAVVHSPVVRRDGSVLDQPGYDELTGLAYFPTPGLVVPSVPEQPTADDIADAVRLIDEMLAGFEFATPNDRANLVGSLVTPLLCELVPPPYKGVFISAANPGSGKTLIATLMRIIHGGVFRTELPGDSEELRKMISSILETTSGSVVHIDNITGVVRSSVLAGLFTSRDYSDRRLGVLGQVKARNDRTWVFTGNNAKLGGDMVRRAVMVTLAPTGPNPHLRSGFAIGDLESWAEERRGELLAALLTLVRAWVAAGSPQRVTTSDSYKYWTAAVRGILGHAGVPGTFDGTKPAKAAVGDDDQEWADFLVAVRAEFGEQRWTARQVLEKVRVPNGRDGDEQWASQRAHPIPMEALPQQIADEAGRSRNGVVGQSKRLGRWLSNRDGRWAGLIRSCEAGDNGKGSTFWKIETAPGSGDNE